MRWWLRRPSPATRAGGFVTAQFVLAVAFSLLLFVMLCNAIVYQYGRGVIRSALDEGVRSGSRASGSAATCQQAAEEVRHSLLGGPIGAHVSLRCGLVAGQVRATASGYLPSWLPLMPDWPVALSAAAVKEPFSAPTTTVLGSQGALR
jgi:ABC-type Fe3+ transport system permease subunit